MKSITSKIVGLLILMCFVAITITACGFISDIGGFTGSQVVEELDVTAQTITHDTNLPTPSLKTAKEVVELYVSAIFRGDFELAMSLIDEESIIASGNDEEAIIDQWTAFLFKSNYVFEDTLVQSTGIRDDYEGFTVNIRVLENDEVTTINEEEIFTVRRNDGYKILYAGAISRKEYYPPDTNNDLLNIFVPCIVEHVNGYTIAISAVNNTSYDYKPGWVGSGEVVVDTATATKSIGFSFDSVWKANQSYTDYFWFENVSGDIHRISVTNIIRLGSNGLPAVLRDDGTTVVVYDMNPKSAHIPEAEVEDQTARVIENDSVISGELGSFSNNTFEIIVSGISQSGNLVAVSFEIRNKSSRDIQLFGFPSIVIDGQATQAHFFDNVQADHARVIPPDSYCEYTLNFAADIRDMQSIRLQGNMFSLGNFGDLSFNVNIEA